MGKPTAYIETTVVGYLTARPVADRMVCGHMEFTRSWWADAPRRFDLFVSQLVIDEASAGDPQAAAERLKKIDALPRLAVAAEAREMALALLRAAAVPAKADRDALHVGIAATNGIDYLVSWNCRHLANATLRPMIEKVCRDRGFVPPLICTPLELIQVQP
jgi:hypothetical protein